jgi:predicted component of viral defense system (DUF524 family)
MAEDNLPRAVEEMLSEAHAALVTEISMRSGVEVEEPNVETLMETLDASLFDAGGPLAGLFRGYTPRELPVAEVAEIIDTPENRYVKYFLEECALLAQWLATNLRTKGKPAATREAERNLFWMSLALSGSTETRLKRGATGVPNFHHSAVLP